MPAFQRWRSRIYHNGRNCVCSLNSFGNSFGSSSVISFSNQFIQILGQILLDQIIETEEVFYPIKRLNYRSEFDGSKD